MKPAPFIFHAPKTVDDVVAKLAELGPLDGRILAGGQSLVPMMAFRMARPAHLIDINSVAGLDRLAIEDGVLTIGASVRHAAFHRRVVPGPAGALLSARRLEYCALSDPAARHVLRQPGPCRPGFGMVSHRRDARRRDRRREPARPPRHRRRRLFRGHDGDGARRG